MELCQFCDRPAASDKHLTGDNSCVRASLCRDCAKSLAAKLASNSGCALCSAEETNVSLVYPAKRLQSAESVNQEVYQSDPVGVLCQGCFDEWSQKTQRL
jgi:hypothetical protein